MHSIIASSKKVSVIETAQDIPASSPQVPKLKEKIMSILSQDNVFNDHIAQSSKSSNLIEESKRSHKESQLPPQLSSIR